MIRFRLDRFFSRTAPAEPGDTLLVAFSGGPDSTALLRQLSLLATERRWRLRAAHVDHALDSGSAERARRARQLADAIGVRLAVDTLSDAPEHPAGGLEAWARRHRYRFLERHRLDIGARYLVTAHHRDDQIETVLVRWMMGSGLAGLGAMRSRRGPLVRPLLGVDRESLRRSLRGSGLEPVHDPTNLDPTVLRNRVRRYLLPYLTRAEPEVGERLFRLADASRRVADSLERRLTSRLEPRREERGASIDLGALRRLPGALRPFALALLHRAADRPYPAGRAARRELDRQLSVADRVGCDCGDGWRWTARGKRLVLAPPETVPGAFAYTLEAPGEVDIPPLGLRLSITRATVASWMFEGRPDRAALRLPADCLDGLTVRNRRPGDRVQPLGCDYRRRLKDLLIDRAVPRRRRDRLPLLCHGERILWVPGVTIDHDLRIDGQGSAWVARLKPLEVGSGELPSTASC